MSRKTTLAELERLFSMREVRKGFPDQASRLSWANQVAPLLRFNQRMQECRLELHPEKTKIVYCKDDDRRGTYSHEQFDVLG